MTVDLHGGATGSTFTHHDPLYAWATAGLSGGTLVSDDNDPAVIARRTLAGTGTDGVKALFPIGANWRAVALRWAWCREATGAGNVRWRVRYSLHYPLLGQVVTALSMTTAATVTIAAPGSAAGASAYALPTETSAIETPVDGFFGTSPLFHCSVDRLGDDGADTLAGAVGIYSVTLTRVD